MQNLTKLIVGNWKMNGLSDGATALADAVVAGAASAPADMVLCPPATLLSLVSRSLSQTRIGLGGQDCHAEEKGAFTGDISAEMLADIGARYVIVGHSERRAQHHESSELVARKAAAAHRAGLIPIICVGETLAVREAGRAEAAVVDELERSLHANADEFENLVVAYEPVWAIGTGRTCASRDIAAMHEVLRRRLTEKHPALAETRILYGGSVKSDNAREILSIPNVDGALVGGASLDAKSFLAIAEAAS